MANKKNHKAKKATRKLEPQSMISPARIALGEESIEWLLIRHCITDSVMHQTKRRNRHNMKWERRQSSMNLVWLLTYYFTTSSGHSILFWFLQMPPLWRKMLHRSKNRPICGCRQISIKRKFVNTIGIIRGLFLFAMLARKRQIKHHVMVIQALAGIFKSQKLLRHSVLWAQLCNEQEPQEAIKLTTVMSLTSSRSSTLAARKGKG